MNDKLKSYYVDNRGFFLRPFSILGRIGRREYICALLVYFFIFLLVTYLQEDDTLSGGESFLLWLLQMAGYVFFICEAVKRCHDRNSPGFFIIIPFYCIFLIFAPGTKGRNDYGNSPRDPKDESVDLTNVEEEETEEIEEDETIEGKGVHSPMGANWNMFGSCPEIISEEIEDPAD